MTSRVLTCTPPPHLRVHNPNSLHGVTRHARNVAHGCVLHARVSTRLPQLRPPGAAALIIARVRFWVPDAHDLVHSVKGDHLVTSQSVSCPFDRSIASPSEAIRLNNRRLAIDACQALDICEDGRALDDISFAAGNHSKARLPCFTAALVTPSAKSLEPALSTATVQRDRASMLTMVWSIRIICQRWPKVVSLQLCRRTCSPSWLASAAVRHVPLWLRICIVEASTCQR